MRLRTRNLTIALAAVALAALAGSPVRAQAPVPIEGTVLKAKTREPVVGATVDIYRTDIKGKFTTKTNAKGVFTYPVPQQGSYSLIISAPDLYPQFLADVRPSLGLKQLSFEMAPGKGEHPTLEDIARASSGGKEDEAAAAERAKAMEEHAKALAEKEKFDARKTHFDAGIAAMQTKDYNTAIAELTAATDGLENANPEFFSELASVGGSNLAETHYRVAVDLYNQKQRDEAKKHLEAGAKAAALAVKFNSAAQVNYTIQGKVLLLLVDKFGVSDDAEAGAAAFTKAAEMETADPKKKIAYLVQAGDVYRAALLTDKAIDIYKQVLASDPGNVSAYYGIGLAAMAVSTDDAAKQKQYYQTAADYLDEFVHKAPSSDTRAGEVKGLLDILAKDFKIKPRPIK